MQEMKKQYDLVIDNEKTVPVCEDGESRSVEVPLSITITDEDVDDILVSAFEGGINYWCNGVTILGNPVGDCASEHISRGGDVLIHDGEEGKEYKLTKDDVIRGIIKYVMNPTSCDILENVNHKLVLDTGYVDAGVADSIIQYALFGEILYA